MAGRRTTCCWPRSSASTATGADVVNMSIGDARSTPGPSRPPRRAARAPGAQGRRGSSPAGRQQLHRRPVRRGRAGRGRRRDRHRLGGQHGPVRAGVSRSRPTITRVRIMPGNGSAPIPASGTGTFSRRPELRPRSTTPATRCRRAASPARVALVRRGTCTFFVKATNVVAAGATGHDRLQQRRHVPRDAARAPASRYRSPTSRGADGRTDRRPPQDGGR